MKIFWVGSWLIGLKAAEIFWQRKPYTDFEGRPWHITFPWCWLSATWRTKRTEQTAWDAAVEHWQQQEAQHHDTR